MPSKMGWIAIVVVAGIIAFGALLVFEYYTGGNAAKLAQANAQIKHDKQLRDRDAKIAKSVPFSGGAVDQFLLSHTRKQ